MSRADAIIRTQPIRFYDDFDTELNLKRVRAIQNAVFYRTTDNIEFQVNNINILWFMQQFLNNLFDNALTDWSQYAGTALPLWTAGSCGGDNTAAVSKATNQQSRTLYQQLSLVENHWYRVSIDICDLIGAGTLNVGWSSNGSLGGFTTLDSFTIDAEGNYTTYIQWSEFDGDYDIGFTVADTGTISALEISRIRWQIIDMNYADCETDTLTAISASAVDSNYITFSVAASIFTNDVAYYFTGSGLNGLLASNQFVVTTQVIYQLVFSHPDDGVFGLKWSDFTDSQLKLGFRNLDVGRPVFENENGETYMSSAELNYNLYSQIKKKVTITIDHAPQSIHECLAYLIHTNTFLIAINGDTRQYVALAADYSPTWEGYRQANVQFECYEYAQPTGIVKNSANIP